MNKWKEILLGDVIEVVNGFAFKSSNFLNEKLENSLPVIKIKNVANGDVHLKGCQFHQYSYALEKFVINKGDILIALTGNHPEVMTQVVGEASRYKLNEKAFLNQRVAKILPKDNKILNNDFLYYFLKDDNTHDYLASQSTGSANQANISKDDVENIPIELPTLNEQISIADVLGSLDNKIDLLTRQNKTLEALGVTLFKYQIINADIQEIETLGKLFDVGIGRTPPRIEPQWFSINPSDIKWISIKDLGKAGVYIDRTAEYLTEKAVEQFNIPVIPKNTVLLSFKLTLGRVAITTEPMLSNEAIAHLKIKEGSKFYPEFIYLFLKAFNYSSLGSTSSIAEAINSQMIKQIEMPVPDDETLNLLKELVMPLFKKMKSNSEQIKTLIQLRDTLLPKLMCGEVILK